tara:strand:- start:1519 stop:2196 length:678 start_codon:yes stop_codon:yes gene_type:complete
MRKHKSLKDGHPIFKAAIAGDIEYLKKYLAKGGEVYVESRKNPSPAILATQKGHSAFLNLLIEAGLELNEPVNVGGEFLLHMGMRHPELVRLMVESGANVNLKSVYGSSPLKMAVSSGLEQTKLLVESGADLEKSQGLLCNAAQYGPVDVLDYLMKLGYDNIEEAVSNGRTPLHVAALTGRLDTVKWFVEKGANVNNIDSFGTTPIEMARRNGHTEVVDFLSNSP